MLALPEKCIHPKTGKPYVKSYSGGRDLSPEGQQVVRYHYHLFYTALAKTFPGRLLAWLRVGVRE